MQKILISRRFGYDIKPKYYRLQPNEPDKNRSPGRPTKKTLANVEAMLYAFERGATFKEAAAEIDVNVQTIWVWYWNDPYLKRKIDLARKYVDEVAKAVVARDIVDNKSVESAKWWLERRKRSEFASRVENVNANLDFTQLEKQIENEVNQEYAEYAQAQLATEIEPKKLAHDTPIQDQNENRPPGDF